MSRALQFVAFYAVFFMILWSMHLYVALRLGKLFGCQSTWLLVGACTISAMNFPVFSLLEKFHPTPVSMAFYSAASVLLGFVFLLLSILIVYEAARFIIPLQQRSAAIAMTGAGAALCLYGFCNALIITVRPVEIPMPGLAKPLKIAQLSDIHVGTIHNSGFLTRIVEKTNALDPDLVLITGDLFDGMGPVDRHTIEPLSQLRAKSYFVIGNHERYDDLPKIQAILPEAGVELLRNRIVDFQGVQIIGVDSPVRDGDKTNPVIEKLGVDRSRPSVLMYHIPAGVEEAARAGVRLQLSGHTHNGQLFPFTLLVRLFYSYTKGLYEVNGMRLYVSPGTGTWGPPLRIGSSNEITLITLVPQP